jgi:predicted O-methyltransferase YrrM
MYATTVSGWMSDLELDAIVAIARDVKPKTVVEIGSWVGRSASAWAEALPEAEIYCVDPWPSTKNHNLSNPSHSIMEEPYEAFLKNTARFRNIHPLRMKSDQLADVFLPPIDLVFIDGDHSGPALARDLETARTITEDCGVICGHDYDNPATPDVKPEVHDFCCALQYRFRLYPDTWIFRLDSRYRERWL